MSKSLIALEHDVAKYILRTARNLPDGPVPGVLRPMLIRDFYGKENERGPAERFGEHAAALDSSRREACLRDFQRLAELEAQVRAGDEAATHEALALARAIAARIYEARKQ